MDTLTQDPQLFPRLETHQLTRLRELGGRQEEVKAGQVLVEQGERDFCFFVVLRGCLDVLQETDQGHRLVVQHREGNFFGDSHCLSGRSALVRLQAAEDSSVLRFSADQLRQLVAVRSELSDLIMYVFLNRRAALIKGSLSSLRVIGSRFSSDTHRIREFLTKNSQPFVWLDLENDPALLDVLDAFQLKLEDTPVLLCSQRAHRNPSNSDIAGCLGLNRIPEVEVHDVVVVGAGPAGLAATVYAASEGLEVVTLDCSGPGGQAGTSSKIENYLGFPSGISGQELADRALLQAQKFGATLASARRVLRLECQGPTYLVHLEDGTQLQTRGVVVASGARYRKLELPELARFEGRGVYYGATAMEGMLCKNSQVVVVGAGNSAGQACVFLSGVASRVHLVVRGQDLDSSMSRYLIRRIEETENIELHLRTEVTALHGDDHLERLEICERLGGQVRTLEASALFSMVGANPKTEWLAGCVALDSKGFVLTGRDLSAEQLTSQGWKAARSPYPYETSLPRIFAVGDVRSDSTKRVATAVGEGSAAIHFLHRSLADNY
ncbi:MAG: FAD-dependent oxidoreductase [Candidatus Eremiobacteraeota bacterium]|nr:FAD-dependent oxidoreductase [Candidatus Eremiobacteraeota bacterium]